MTMLTAQKNILKELIISPIIDTLVEKCRSKDIVMILINEAKKGQLGREKFERIFGRYDSNMLDALNGISRLYEDPNRVLKSTFGEDMPVNNEIIAAVDEIIGALINLYYVNGDQPHSEINGRAEFMRRIRERLVALQDNPHLDQRMIVADIMQLKQQAGIPNLGEGSFWWSNLNLSNLDLSNLDLSMLQFKAVSFINSNLSHTKLRIAMRCVFDGANLENANFKDANMTGEQVSFNNANVRFANFTGAVIERGTSWYLLRDPELVKTEIQERGALNVDQAIFREPPYQALVHNGPAPVFVNPEPVNQQINDMLRREWASRTAVATVESTQEEAIPQSRYRNACVIM